MPRHNFQLITTIRPSIVLLIFLFSFNVFAQQKPQPKTNFKFQNPKSNI